MTTALMIVLILPSMGTTALRTYKITPMMTRTTSRWMMGMTLTYYALLVPMVMAQDTQEACPYHQVLRRRHPPRLPCGQPSRPLPWRRRRPAPQPLAEAVRTPLGRAPCSHPPETRAQILDWRRRNALISRESSHPREFCYPIRRPRTAASGT